MIPIILGGSNAIIETTKSAITPEM